MKILSIQATSIVRSLGFSYMMAYEKGYGIAIQCENYPFHIEKTFRIDGNIVVYYEVQKRGSFKLLAFFSSIEESTK